MLEQHELCMKIMETHFQQHFFLLLVDSSLYQG